MWLNERGALKLILEVAALQGPQAVCGMVARVTQPRSLALRDAQHLTSNIEPLAPAQHARSSTTTPALNCTHHVLHHRPLGLPRRPAYPAHHPCPPTMGQRRC